MNHEQIDYESIAVQAGYRVMENVRQQGLWQWCKNPFEYQGHYISKEEAYKQCCIENKLVV